MCTLLLWIWLTGCEVSAFTTPAGPDVEPYVELSGVDGLPERVAVRHVLVAWKGAASAPPNVTRSKREAFQKARSLREEVLGGTSLETVAVKESDDLGSRGLGGMAGAAERGVWVAEFESVAFRMPVGAISGIVESPFGYHLLERLPLEEVRVRHILVTFQGARGVSPDSAAAQRSPEEAAERVAAIQAALAAGQPFDEVARRWSDGGTGLRGEDLGAFVRGEMSPSFDAAVFSLEPGQWTEPLRTDWGYHLLQRLPDEPTGAPE